MLIYLVDLTHESKMGLGSDTMPLQLGLIGSYCIKRFGEKVEIEIFKFVKDLSEAILHRKPDIIGASNYLWNTALTSSVLKEVKKFDKNIVTVCGGPDYPEDYDEQKKWLLSHPEVDFYIYKDGEVPFSELVNQFLNSNDIGFVKKLSIISCHSIDGEKSYFGETAPRLSDLSDIPSPYKLGLMDKFFDQKLIPSIQTNRGCPFSCSYCTEGNNYYCKVSKNTLQNKLDEVEYIAQRTKHTPTLRIADSNFGMYEEDVEFCSYLGKIQKKYNYPLYVNCSTGKNRKDLVLKCNEYLNGAIRLTASVQSLDPTVLKLAKRVNISLNDIIALSMKVSDTDTHAYSEIILALPGDTLSAEKESMSGLIRAGISNITQHQLSMISGSAVNLPEMRKEHGIVTMFRPIQRCLGKYKFLNNDITAIEIEEICVANNTMTFNDYLEARSYYLTVGLFYNDRIFREIHALLCLLSLSTWEWLTQLHKNSNNISEIKAVYDGFISETKNELWNTRQKLVADINAKLDEYASGEIGGNIIYKYRAKMIINDFSKFHDFAFQQLRIFVKNKNIVNAEDIINDLERFSKCSKTNIFDTSQVITDDFQYNIVKLLSNYLSDTALNSYRERTRIIFAHSDQQKELINKQLAFYGSDAKNITMLLSRFPVKRFYRKAMVV